MILTMQNDYIELINNSIVIFMTNVNITSLYSKIVFNTEYSVYFLGEISLDV
jgi:hypothetical protein